MTREFDSPAGKKLMELINNKKMASRIGATLAEVAVELADKIAEAKHWKQSFETVTQEIKILAAVAMRQQGVTKLVITRKEQEEIPRELELHVSAPEVGVRIYVLRQRGVLHADADKGGGLIRLAN